MSYFLILLLLSDLADCYYNQDINIKYQIYKYNSNIMEGNLRKIIANVTIMYDKSTHLDKTDKDI